MDLETIETSEAPKPGETLNFSQAQQGALCKQLWNLRTEGALCDVMLEVEGEVLHAHKLVLVAGSTHLHSVISKLPTTEDGKVQLHIQDITFKICMKLLDYIYTGRYPEEREVGEEFIDGCKKWSLEFSPNLAKGFLEKNPTNRTSPDGNVNEVIEEISDHDKTNYKRDEDRFKDLPDVGVKRVVSQTRKGKGPKRLVSRKTGKRTSKKMKILKKNLGEKSVSETADVLSGEENDSSLDTSTCRDIEGSPVFLTADSVGLKMTLPNEPETDLTDSSPENIKTKQVVQDKTKSSSNKRQAKKTPPDGESTYRCGYCGSKFNSQAELKVHRVEDHRQKKKAESWCTLCKVRFNGRNLLLAHNMERHWAEGMELPKLYKCNKTGCDFTTYVQGTWYAHMSHMHNTEPIVCEICGRSYKHKFSLSSHMRHAHGPQKEFPCDECERVFASDTGLRNHRKLAHSPESRLQHICPHCGHTSLCLSTLSEHLYTKHNILPKGRTGHECKYCDFKTLTVSVLNRHQSRHNPDRPYKCDKCNKSYTDRNQLKYHQIKHDTSAKMHQCQYCDYSTKYPQHFKEHVQVRHEKKDYKPYNCDECSYRCNSRGNLYKHLRKVHKRVVETKQKLSKVTDLARQPVIQPQQFNKEDIRGDTKRENLEGDNKDHGNNKRKEPQLHLLPTQGESQHIEQLHQHIQHPAQQSTHQEQQTEPQPSSHNQHSFQYSHLHPELPPDHQSQQVPNQKVSSLPTSPPAPAPAPPTALEHGESPPLPTRQPTYLQLPILLSQPTLHPLQPLTSLPSFSHGLLATPPHNIQPRTSDWSTETPATHAHINLLKKESKLSWGFIQGPLGGATEGVAVPSSEGDVSDNGGSKGVESVGETVMEIKPYV